MTIRFILITCFLTVACTTTDHPKSTLVPYAYNDTNTQNYRDTSTLATDIDRLIDRIADDFSTTPRRTEDEILVVAPTPPNTPDNTPDDTPDNTPDEPPPEIPPDVPPEIPPSMPPDMPLEPPPEVPLIGHFAASTEVQCISGLCQGDVLLGSADIEIDFRTNNLFLKDLNASDEAKRVILSGDITYYGRGNVSSTDAQAELTLSIEDEIYFLDQKARLQLSRNLLKEDIINGKFFASHTQTRTRLAGNLKN